MCDYNRVGGKTQNITRVVGSIWNVNVGVSVRLFLVRRRPAISVEEGSRLVCVVGEKERRGGFLGLSGGGMGGRNKGYCPF